MRKLTLLRGLPALLLLGLWVYTAVSKLLEYEVFASQLQRQPFPDGLADILTWLLPAVELLAAGLLLNKRTRRVGLWVSLGLLLAFTGYVGLALAGVWGKVPCACGGVIGSLGWRNHLYFNLGYTAVAALGLLVSYTKQTVPTPKGGSRSQGATAAGEAAYRSGGTN